MRGELKVTLQRRGIPDAIIDIILGLVDWRWYLNFNPRPPPVLAEEDSFSPAGVFLNQLYASFGPGGRRFSEIYKRFLWRMAPHTVPGIPYPITLAQYRWFDSHFR
tara:strand:+ start:3772 stop:4089 length:318 start_codon:yes stop_codon:yes gene_type:complete